PRPSARRLVPRDAGALVKLFPVLEAVEPFALALPIAEGDSHSLRRRGFGALRELLGRLAAGQPVALHLDDLRWGDEGSAGLLAHFWRPPVPPPILLILPYRAEDESGSPVVEALRGLGDSVDVDLRPLAPAEIGQLARRLLAGRTIVDEELVRWVAR